MRWHIEERVVCELWSFTGINFGGTKRITRIHAYGGRQGDDFPGDEVKSLGIVAEPGIRVILVTARTDHDWEALPWRCIQILEGHTSALKDGRSAIQIPDLDRYDPVDSDRTDYDLETVYPFAATVAEGEGWTFGRPGRKGIKARINGIRIERIPE